MVKRLVRYINLVCFGINVSPWDKANAQINIMSAVISRQSPIGSITTNHKMRLETIQGMPRATTADFTRRSGRAGLGLVAFNLQHSSLRAKRSDPGLSCTTLNCRVASLLAMTIRITATCFSASREKVGTGFPHKAIRQQTDRAREVIQSSRSAL